MSPSYPNDKYRCLGRTGLAKLNVLHVGLQGHDVSFGHLALDFACLQPGSQYTPANFDMVDRVRSWFRHEPESLFNPEKGLPKKSIQNAASECSKAQLKSKRGRGKPANRQDVC